MEGSVRSSNRFENEMEDLRQRLEEAEEALRAIRSGEVDALVIDTQEGERIYTLQDSEHAYRVMVETMSEGAATLLEDGTILYCNARLAEMLETPLEQLLGSCFYHFLDPDDSDRFSTLLSQGVKSEARAELLLNVNGKLSLPALLSMRMLPLEGQHPAACLIVTGIAEQSRSRAELEARVAERTAELAQRNRDLEDFASAISHDLKEPLRKVDNFSKLLVRNASGNLDPTELDYIQRMQDASNRMSSMIDGLLALARLSTRANAPQNVDLNQVVRDVLSIFEPTLEKTGGRVVVEELPVIEAEPLQMQQLFQNLIGNAIKFHRSGIPPSVKVYCREAPVTNNNAPKVQIFVEDQGIGIPEDQVQMLFQPFKRLVNRRDYEGNGIGLAICKKIVERHGGQISAKSDPGIGSTFIVSLPVVKV